MIWSSASKHSPTAAVLFVLWAGTVSTAADKAKVPSAPRISVFVSAQVQDGFLNVDDGVRDSIKDIQSEIRKSKTLALADTTEDARVVITVIGRNSPGNSHRVPFPVGPGMSMMMPVRRRAIDLVLRVGAIQREMTSEPEGDDRWKAAARQVVKDVAAFVDANRAALKTP